MYKIVRERGEFGLRGALRILNTNNNILHPLKTTSLAEAKDTIKTLEGYARFNRSSSGRARTARHNANLVAQYHKSKTSKKTK